MPVPCRVSPASRKDRRAAPDIAVHGRLGRLINPTILDMTCIETILIGLGRFTG